MDEKLEALIKEKLEEKLDQWVNLTFCPEGSLAPAAGALEGQQAFGSLENQPGVEQYRESQESGTEAHTKPEEVDGLLNSSAETLPNIPKTPTPHLRASHRVPS